jgi:hypothetical protein
MTEKPRRGGIPLRGTCVHEDRRARVSDEEVLKEMEDAVAEHSENRPFKVRARRRRPRRKT